MNKSILYKNADYYSGAGTIYTIDPYGANKRLVGSNIGNIRWINDITPTSVHPSNNYTWKLKFSNADDIQFGSVNHIPESNDLLRYTGNQEVEYDITQYITSGQENKIFLNLYNISGGFSYGFKLLRNEQEVYYDFYNNQGYENYYDNSYLYNITITINAEGEVENVNDHTGLPEGCPVTDTIPGCPEYIAPTPEPEPTP